MAHSVFIFVPAFGQMISATTFLTTHALQQALAQKGIVVEGMIMHATLKIGDSMLMLNDEFPEWGSLGPSSAGGIGVIIHMYLENVDAAFQRVVSAGATVKMPLSDAFWGDRYGAVVDPFGHTWSLASKVKDVSKDELDNAAQDMFGHGTKKSA